MDPLSILLTSVITKLSDNLVDNILENKLLVWIIVIVLFFGIAGSSTATPEDEVLGSSDPQGLFINSFDAYKLTKHLNKDLPYFKTRDLNVSGWHYKLESEKVEVNKEFTIEDLVEFTAEYLYQIDQPQILPIGSNNCANEKLTSVNITGDIVEIQLCKNYLPYGPNIIDEITYGKESTLYPIMNNLDYLLLVLDNTFSSINYIGTSDNIKFSIWIDGDQHALRPLSDKRCKILLNESVENYMKNHENLKRAFIDYAYDNYAEFMTMDVVRALQKCMVDRQIFNPNGIFIKEVQYETGFFSPETKKSLEEYQNKT